MKYFFWWFFFLWCHAALAQPGGGGGISIIHVCDENLVAIQRADTSYSWMVLKMDGHDPNAAIEKAQIPLQPRYWYQHQDGLLSLSCPTGSHRIIGIHSTDTMMVDLYNIMGENGAGISEVMDSLVFRKGAFSFDCGYIDQKMIPTRSRGITPSSFIPLVEAGILIEYNFIPSKFLLEKNFSASHMLELASQCVYEYKRYNEGIEWANKAREKGLNKVDDRRARMTIAKGEEGLGNLEQAYDIVRSMHENSPDAAVYTIELELLKKMGRHQEALEIHDWICRDGAHWNISSRAIYRATYLKDYWGALNDWDQIINNIPEKYITDRWMGSNEYGYAYSQRALVQFALNNPSKGYSDFYHSMYFFGNEQQIPTILNALDSLDRRGFNDPKVPLIRAMASMRAGMDYMNTDRQKESAYEKAIKYFDKVDKSYRNFGDYYFFLAEAHFLYKKYDEAYAAIQTAFKYDDENPRYYMMRYVIRIRLDGDRKTGADEDRVRSNELAQKAKYPIK